MLGKSCERDAYYLEEIDQLEQEQGLPKGYYRGAIKKITQALINCPKGVKGERCKLPDGVSLRPHFNRAEIQQMIVKKHHLIAKFFANGKGLALQRSDSDLALQVIINLQKKEILALPIHDSFIVNDIYENELFTEMTNCYKDKFAFDPIIK